MTPGNQLLGRRSQNVSSGTVKFKVQLRSLIGQGQLFASLQQVERAKESYRQALDIAEELSDRKRVALLSWQLGLLYADTDPAQAVRLMSICVDYERENDLPTAAADAELVAQIQARA